MKELQPENGWMQTARPRLPVPPPAARGLLFRSVSLFAGVLGRSEMPDILAVINLNPRLFWAWLFFASRLMPYGLLPGPVREKIILRTGWNCRSRYEWGQHVDIGLNEGVSDAEILQVAQGPAAFSDPVERALMQACDEMHRDYAIADATWAVLAGTYSKSLLVEIVVLIGHYQMIAGFLNSAGIILEPDIEEKLQAFHRRVEALQPAS